LMACYSQPASQQHPSQLYLIRVQAIAGPASEPTMLLLCDRTQQWGWVMFAICRFFFYNCSSSVLNKLVWLL
jgi:hypothetical protein